MKLFTRTRRHVEHFIDEAPDSRFMPWVYGGLVVLILVAAAVALGIFWLARLLFRLALDFGMC